MRFMDQADGQRLCSVEFLPRDRQAFGLRVAHALHQIGPYLRGHQAECGFGQAKHHRGPRQGHVGDTSQAKSAAHDGAL